MAVRRNIKTGYGFGQGLISTSPQPIIANRFPKATDKAELGTIWIQKYNNGDGTFSYGSYILTAIKNNAANWQIIGNDCLKASVASPTATAVINSDKVSATFTGFTTAATASQVFIITNSWSVAGTQIMATASNGGANDAQMTVTRIQVKTGSIEVTLKNNGAAALNGDVVITIDMLLENTTI